MKKPPQNSTERFSALVDDYVRYRPGYPENILDALKKQAGLTVDSIIADIGSGTGISAKLFLTHGNIVYGVEPNDRMRKAAGSLLQKYPGFHSVRGTAEATTLEDESVDFVVAAQAFHWFDPDAAVREFARILNPAGQVVLMWNTRRSNSTGFLRAYEAFLGKHGTDYRQVNHRNLDESKLCKLFLSCRKQTFYNEQVLDYEGLKGRLLSSSYIPAPDNQRHGPMLEDLGQLFEKYNQQGYVRIEYDTEIHFGRPRRPGKWTTTRSP